jgi:hypothetical protein
MRLPLWRAACSNASMRRLLPFLALLCPIAHAGD